jgi:hypothetical protein
MDLFQKAWIEGLDETDPNCVSLISGDFVHWDRYSYEGVVLPAV